MPILSRLTYRKIPTEVYPPTFPNAKPHSRFFLTASHPLSLGPSSDIFIASWYFTLHFQFITLIGIPLLSISYVCPVICAFWLLIPFSHQPFPNFIFTVVLLWNLVFLKIKIS
jgi:hypothetical protein